MEDNKNLLNKTDADLTIKDRVIVQIATPVIAVGSCVLIGAVFCGAEKAVAKVKAVRANRHAKRLIEK